MELCDFFPFQIIHDWNGFKYLFHKLLCDVWNIIISIKKNYSHNYNGICFFSKCEQITNNLILKLKYNF